MHPQLRRRHSTSIANRARKSFRSRPGIEPLEGRALLSADPDRLRRHRHHRPGRHERRPLLLRHDAAHGEELWRSDGTSAGTYLLKDIHPGSPRLGARAASPSWATRCSSRPTTGPTASSCGRATGRPPARSWSRTPIPGAWARTRRTSCNVNGTLVLPGVRRQRRLRAVQERRHGRRHGHGQGHLPRLHRLLPRQAHGGGRHLLLHGQRRDPRGRAVEERRDGGRHRPWSRTSTPARPAPRRRYLDNVSGTLFFTAYEPTNGMELWKSDGTAAGTVHGQGHRPGDGQLHPLVPDQRQRDAVLRGHRRRQRDELWKSDGTAAGTVHGQGHLSPARTGSQPRNLPAVGGTLFFTADDGVHGNELWKSDGTAAGTVHGQGHLSRRRWFQCGEPDRRQRNALLHGFHPGRTGLSCGRAMGRMRGPSWCRISIPGLPAPIPPT